jgi:hypothetical protein
MGVYRHRAGLLSSVSVLAFGQLDTTAIGAVAIFKNDPARVDTTAIGSVAIFKNNPARVDTTAIGAVAIYKLI